MKGMLMPENNAPLSPEAQKMHDDLVAAVAEDPSLAPLLAMSEGNPEFFELLVEMESAGGNYGPVVVSATDLHTLGEAFQRNAATVPSPVAWVRDYIEVEAMEKLSADVLLLVKNLGTTLGQLPEGETITEDSAKAIAKALSGISEKFVGAELLIIGDHRGDAQTKAHSVFQSAATEAQWKVLLQILDQDADPRQLDEDRTDSLDLLAGLYNVHFHATADAVIAFNELGEDAKALAATQLNLTGDLITSALEDHLVQIVLGYLALDLDMALDGLVDNVSELKGSLKSTLRGFLTYLTKVSPGVDVSDSQARLDDMLDQFDRGSKLRGL
jgi:hypothetical protein